ncbi:MAG: Uma2 family endonuclease [bacterium]|nr:Uma2 family endonuclease [bacterium]
MAEPAYALPEPDAQQACWPAQGQWTWEDYLRLPDDGQRYEIIEGVLYVSPAPTFDHQFSLSELFAELRNFVKARKLGLVLFAPFDVRLPGVADPVEPDLLFFRTGNQPHAGDKYFAGVPDLIVEVLSPRTSRLDKHVKFGAYEKAGVPEYWLVDPKSRSITVYHLDIQRREYDELGGFGSDETVRSRLLEGFEVAVAALFPPPKA